MNNSAVVKIVSHPDTGILHGLIMTGAPKELQDRVKAMLQNKNISRRWDGAVCFIRDRSGQANFNVSNVLDWVLASGWTLTQCFSSTKTIDDGFSVDTYVFQK